MANAIDLRKYFTSEQIQAAEQELEQDKDFQRELGTHGLSLRDLWITKIPPKYLGIELAEKKSRFALQDVLREVLKPHSHDDVSKGLHKSAHRNAFIKKFGGVDKLLSKRGLNKAAVDAPIGSKKEFENSEYGNATNEALKRLHAETGIPMEISREVLRKGLAAYKSAHRPGMSAHGWARARLSSFTMKGCTHYFPDHKLAYKCPEETKRMWKGMPCLCHKQNQCGHYGKRTAANRSRF